MTLVQHSSARNLRCSNELAKRPKLMFFGLTALAWFRGKGLSKKGSSKVAKLPSRPQPYNPCVQGRCCLASTFSHKANPGRTYGGCSPKFALYAAQVSLWEAGKGSIRSIAHAAAPLRTGRETKLHQFFHFEPGQVPHLNKGTAI